MSKKKLVFFLFFVFAIASRFAILAGPQWANFTPMGAMALFFGYYSQHKGSAYVWTLTAYWFSNLLLNNFLYPSYFDGFSWGWDGGHFLLFALITALGQGLSSVPMRTMSFFGFQIGAGLLFFLVSNFDVWMGSQVLYPKTWNGLMACYAAGLPFLKNTLASQLVFGMIFFGIYEWKRAAIERSVWSF